MIADVSVHDGHEGNCMILDWLCSKIEQKVRSSFEAELRSAQMVADAGAVLRALWVMLMTGMNPREYREQRESLTGLLIGDNKGLYTAMLSYNPIARRGDKRLQVDKAILWEHLLAHCLKYRWTNAGHQDADALTKLSSGSARVDLLLDVMNKDRVRVHYCTVSGRKEAAMKNAAANPEPQLHDLAEQDAQEPEGEKTQLADGELDDSLEAWYSGDLDLTLL